MGKQLTVHGSIFFLLRKFVENALGMGSWEQLIVKAGLKDSSFELTQAYPLETMEAIVNAASQFTGLSAATLKEKFGEQLVPDLFQMYKYYVQPGWKTFDVLLKTEEVMHGAVRKLNSSAHPPILNVSKISDELLMIDYYSKRKMGCLAVGIIKGIAKYYNEDNEITVEPTTTPDAERVQIKVRFMKKIS